MSLVTKLGPKCLASALVGLRPIVQFNIGWYHRIYCKYSSSPGQRGKTITTKTLKQLLCFQNSQLSLKVYYSLLNFYIVNIMVNIVFMWYSLKRCLLAASVMLFPLCNKYLRQLYHNFH